MRATRPLTSRAFGRLAKLLSVVPVVVASLAVVPVVTPTAASAAPTLEVYHDRTGTYHQERWNALTVAGYRMTSLSVYGPPSSPQYAATWIKQTGPSFSGIHNAARTKWDTEVGKQAATGYYPAIVSATGAVSSAVFAGVFEKYTGTLKPYSKPNLTPTTLQTETSNAAMNGYELRWADVYGSSTDPRIIAAFWPRATSGGAQVRSANSAPRPAR